MSCARKEIPSEFSSLFCISIHKQLSMTPRSKIESNPNFALGHPFWSNFTYSNFSLAHPLSYSLSLKSLPGLDKGLVEVLDRNFFSPSLRIPLLQTCTLRWPKLEICRPFMSAHLTTFSVKFLFFFFKVQAALITIHRKCHNSFSRPGSPAERSPRFSGVFNLRDLMVGMQAIALKIFVLPRLGEKKNMAAQRCQCLHSTPPLMLHLKHALCAEHTI